MDWLERMNNSLKYLEEHLTEKLDMDEVAKVAYSSKFHFQRLFHMLSGITIAEYVRNRRLTLAAQELCGSNTKVIDVAYKYGYESPESFSRAFLKLHGVSPSKVKESGIQLIAYPKLSFQIYLKGEIQMNYRIEKKEAFKIIGTGKEITTVNGENFKLVPKFWQETMENGKFSKIISQSTNGTSYGICMDFVPEEERFNYYIGVLYSGNQNVEDLEVKDIPAHTWAVFDAVGLLPDSIQNVLEKVYHEWFPSTGYEHANGPEIEVYLPGDPSQPDYKCEVWIPIIMK